MKNYYQVLGVSSSATEAELKSAYRKLVKQCHPDIAGDDKEKRKQFEQITAAYEILGDEAARKAYDEKLANPSAGNGPEPSRKQPGTGQRQKNVTPADFADMFESFFGKGTNMNSKNQESAQKVRTDEMFQSFFRPKR